MLFGENHRRLAGSCDDFLQTACSPLLTCMLSPITQVNLQGGRVLVRISCDHSSYMYTCYILGCCSLHYVLFECQCTDDSMDGRLLTSRL